MSVQDLLLGYDAREDWLDFPATWSAKRRQRHLLRQDIVKPISVDTDVWPSVFEVAPGLKRPDWTGYVQNLWDDLAALTRTLKSATSLELEKVSFIAVELVSSTTSGTMLAVWRDRVQTIVPPRLDELPRRLLGYDVADYFLLTGLTNCGSPHWVNPQEWALLLNDYHLFKDTSSAVRFKAEADKHVPEHSPFFIFALWLLDLPSMAPLRPGEP